MQILIVFSSSELGGAERSLTRMAITASDEVEYTLATLDGLGSWVTWCHELDIQPVVLGARKANGRQHGYFGLKALKNLVVLVQRERYEALYVIGLRASLWLRFMRPLLRGARLIHGIRWNPDSNSRLDYALRLTEKLFGSLVDLYICNSHATADTLSHRTGVSPEKISVIYNGLDRLLPVLDRTEIHSFTVVVLANLNPRKGHGDFLNVVEKIWNRLPQVHFIFVGRDDMNGQLHREIARLGLDRVVTLTGYQADVGFWLNQAQLMVLPSLWGEGSPTSILEGFAHGLPVIAYAIDGIPELIIDGVDGVLVPPKDTVALEKAILRVLEEPLLAKCMGTHGHAKVGQQFTLAQCAKQHVTAFSQLIADH